MDQDKLKELYETYSDQIYHYLLRLSGSDERAFDLMQETFLRADRFYKDIQYEKAWLYKIAYNLFLTENKREKRKDSLETPEEIPDADQGSFTGQIDWKLLRAAILERLNQEQEIFGRMFLLRLDQDLTQAEIAEVLDISARTVRRHFEKIRNILIKNFNNELDLVPEEFGA